MGKTVTISEEEYRKLKEQAEVDEELVAKLKRAFEDIKHSRLTEWT